MAGEKGSENASAASGFQSPQPRPPEERGPLRPKPSCPMGYTRDDLAQHFGAVEGQPHPLWDQLRGQTQAICDGRFYDHGKREYEPSPCADHPHGTVAYVWDVAEWVEGRPVSDW